ncbi:hypothetical protein TRIATDRAFT_259778 [Trichoderma atroviride IMI 206040]|uniref:Uncharacterized protein n=1 Tax=Hypocrea atroviridis (strain ATCC 20476 / IMI 206040) TaxID=452589 RepID=G9PA55_HYPAI|nr:uncharacterized protein TRIATDRAFT_259778 [Trichoderma atroviride IMI 206040]EHK39895.1 hypothetical protein TRIATDRAFT_259778 [Trichoderma atroviride IMI 206040]
MSVNVPCPCSLDIVNCASLSALLLRAFKHGIEDSGDDDLTAGTVKKPYMCHEPALAVA